MGSAGSVSDADACWLRGLWSSVVSETQSNSTHAEWLDQSECIGFGAISITSSIGIECHMSRPIRTIISHISFIKVHCQLVFECYLAIFRYNIYIKLA